MENKFKIVEDRGFGILYSVFFGTYKECKEYLETLDLDENNNSTDPECRNGNNQAWTYYIDEDE